VTRAHGILGGGGGGGGGGGRGRGRDRGSGQGRGRLAGLAALVGCLGIGGATALSVAASARAPVTAKPLAASERLTTAAPAGFWNGTDSSYIAIPGPAPYREPVIGGSYGGYIGMVGNWAVWAHCGGTKVVWSTTDSNHARTNLLTYHKGIGVGVYWFMGGPGVDRKYNGTTHEAEVFGDAQAREVLSLLSTRTGSLEPNYPVVFMDVELPGDAPSYTPAPDNGWNTVYTSACSGKVKSTYIPASVDRAEFNAFANYLTSHSAYKAGVYSAPSIWPEIFGTGEPASIPNTYEWTYNADTSSLTHRPDGWCLAGTKTCAQFFGGMTSASKYALMWQWSGGGGTHNGHGDFDQTDANRTP
jgi:hypothetical protein